MGSCHENNTNCDSLEFLNIIIKTEVKRRKRQADPSGMIEGEEVTHCNGHSFRNQIACSAVKEMEQ